MEQDTESVHYFEGLTLSISVNKPGRSIQRNFIGEIVS